MKKTKQLLIQCLSLAAIFGTATFTIVSCGKQNSSTIQRTITFSTSEGGRLIGSTTIQVDHGITWSQVPKPEFKEDFGYLYTGSYCGEKELNDEDIISSDLSVVLKFDWLQPTPTTSFEWRTDEQTMRATITNFIGNETAVRIPSEYISGDKTYVVHEIGDTAFINSKSVKCVFIPDSVRVLGAQPFIDCPNITRLEVDPNNKVLTSRDSLGNECNCIIGFIEHKKTLLYGFSKAIIPSGVQIINAEAFAGCVGLTNISIPAGVTDIGFRAFKECSNLISADIPDTMKNIANEAFADCIKLTSITIPGGVETINKSTFSNCSSLKEINISNGVTTIADNAFSGCVSLATLFIPESVNNISSYAFYSCSGLTEIKVSSNNEKYTSRASGIECDCIIVDENTLILGCQKTFIPDGITVIDSRAFENCIGLTYITLPLSLLNIRAGAFRGCSSLEYIYFPGTLLIWDEVVRKDNGWHEGILAEFVQCADGKSYLHDD